MVFWGACSACQKQQFYGHHHTLFSCGLVLVNMNQNISIRRLCDLEYPTYPCVCVCVCVCDTQQLARRYRRVFAFPRPLLLPTSGAWRLPHKFRTQIMAEIESDQRHRACSCHRSSPVLRSVAEHTAYPYVWLKVLCRAPAVSVEATYISLVLSRSRSRSRSRALLSPDRHIELKDALELVVVLVTER